MPRADYEYFAYLNDQQVLASLLRIEKNMTGLGQKGDRAFQSVGKSAGGFGSIVQGAVMGAVGSLTTSIIGFGRQAVASFKSAIDTSKQMAIEFTTTQRKFVSIFQGNEKAATALMDKVAKRAGELGLEMTEALSVTRAFVPDVKGTEDPLGALDDLLVGLRALAEEDPAQGLIGARFAIDEAMSGSLRSLRSRFEFTKAEIDILKQAQEELGDVVGVIEGINRVMQRRGVDIEALKGTFTQAMGEMTFQVGKFRLAMGEPIVDQMTTQLGKLSDILEEKGGDFELIAHQVGLIVADISKFFSENLNQFLESLDTEQIQAIAADIFEMVQKAEILAETLKSLVIEDSFINDLSDVIDLLDLALDKSIKFVATIRAQNAAAQAEQKALLDAVIAADEASGRVVSERTKTFAQNILALPGGAAGAKTGLGMFGGEEGAAAVREAELAAEQAYQDALNDTMSLYKDMDQALSNNEMMMARRRREQEQDTEAALAEAEAFLKGEEVTQDSAAALQEQAKAARESAAALQEQAQAAFEAGDALTADSLRKQADAAQQNADALSAMADAAEDALAAQEGLGALSEEQAKQFEKAMEDIAKAREQLQFQLEDIEIEGQRKRMDLEVDFQQKRLDMERESLQEIEDIHIQHQQAIEDARQDLGDELADIALSTARRIEDLDRELSNRRVQIEKDTLDRIAAIRLDFRRSIEDAEGAQDALAFIEAVKQRDRAIEDAKRQRDEEKQQVTEDGQRKREDIRLQNAREIEDAHEKNQEVLRDLQTRLERELEEQQLNYARQLEEQTIQEERKREELELSLERQVEDAQKAYDRRLESIMKSLDEEVRGHVKAELAKTLVMEEEMQKRMELLRQWNEALLESMELQRQEQQMRQEQQRQAPPVPTPRERERAPITPPLIPPTFPRQHGGPVRRGFPYLVGEGGPEMFVPATDGMVMSNNQLSQVPSALLYGGRGDTITTMNNQFSLHNPAMLTPEQLAQTRMVAGQIAAEMTKRAQTGR